MLIQILVLWRPKTVRNTLCNMRNQNMSPMQYRGFKMAAMHFVVRLLKPIQLGQLLVEMSQNDVKMIVMNNPAFSNHLLLITLFV